MYKIVLNLIELQFQSYKIDDSLLVMFINLTSNQLYWFILGIQVLVIWIICLKLIFNISKGNTILNVINSFIFHPDSSPKFAQFVYGCPQVKILTFTFVITLMKHKQLKSPILLLILFTITQSFAPTISIQSTNETVAIQQNNQTFFIYIPLSSDCTYPLDTSISLGDVKYTLLDASNIFASICGLNEVVFWGGLVNGLKMLAISQELLQNGQYSQILLFNSSINGNLTQREVILVEIKTNGEILFNYAQPIYNYTANTLTSNIVSQTPYIFNQDIQKIIIDCSQDKLIFAYIGNSTFIGLCLNTTQLFAWNMLDSKISNIFTDLSFLNGDNIQNMTNNPYLLLPNYTVNYTNLQNQNISYWNVAFLSQDATMAYFCSVNISSIKCQNYQKEQAWVEMVIQGGWGIETMGQLSQIQLILSVFPQVTNYTFPGTIISLFSYQTTVFVQSQSNNMTYLSIFTNGKQLANTTLKGAIIYYGEQNLLIQDSNNNYWIADFIIPIYYLQNITTSQQNFTIEVNCSYTEYQMFYQIFWTSMNYPSYLLEQINTTTPVSYEGTFVENMNDFYLVIGPAFQVFITSTENIDIDLLDISEMLTLEAFISVVDIVFISQNGKVRWLPYQAFFLDMLGILKKYSFATQQIVTMPQPCSILTIHKSVKMQQSILFIGQGTLCLCDRSSIQNCDIKNASQIVSTVLINSNSFPQFTLIISQIHQALGLTNFTSNEIKKQISSLASYDLIVNIYQNNTVILVNLEGNYIYSIESGCIDLNSTDGTVFPRNFYDDYLVVYCYNSSKITQYLIRNQQLIYIRDIPLYGFKTISQENSILSGQNYIFLQVDLDPQFYGIFQSRNNASSCCILRLDPDQFTVSFIAQIILANKLITVQSMYGVDVVFYNQTTMSSSIPFIKVYFDSTWVTFKQTAICTPLNLTCPPVTYNYGISYISDFYNFAGAYVNNITFDISASKITLAGSNIQDIELYKHTSTYTIYNNSVIYNFNNFCGPISQFWQTNIANLQGNLFSITQNTIIISNKQITSNYSAIMQIIDIADYAPNNSLSQCLLVVGIKNLTFYVKYDGSWLSTSYVVLSNEQNCLYFIDQIINDYSIEFGSYCFNIQLNTPLITITYNPDLSKPFNATFSTMKLPLQLRSVTSILTNNQTYLIGLQQGPSKSVTGILYLCNSVCNLLTIDTQVIFFIDYDQQVTEQGLLIVSLDIQTLNFWINPNLSPFTNLSLPADYIINYQQTLGSFCSKVKVVYGSLTQPNLILSCSTFYQQITINLQFGNITLGLKFAKFANCEQIDRFKPQFIISPGSQTNIQFLAVQCQQTVSTVRIQQITSQNSNTSSNIVTDYLLIYTEMGPRCSSTYWYPIRIIDLGISGQFMLYNIYYSNNQWKIIYQKINGILIDNFIQMVPQVNYELIEMTRTITYPVITMMINNPYYSLAMTIQTHTPKDSIPIIYFYIILGVFVSFNIITLFFLICWFFLNKKTRKYPNSKYFNNGRKTLTDKTLSSKLFISDKESNFSSIYQNSSSISRQKPSLNEQVQSSVGRAEPKRRGTQIELFQPR